jgi:hypothetical protein
MHSEVEISMRNPVAYITQFGLKVEIVGTDFRLLVWNWESVQWGEYALWVLRGPSFYSCALVSTALVTGSPHLRELTFDHQPSRPTGYMTWSTFDFFVRCRIFLFAARFRRNVRTTRRRIKWVIPSFLWGKGGRTAKCGRQYLMRKLVDRILPCFMNAFIS